MAWEIEFTDDFGEWWDGLTGDAQEDVNAGVVALREFGTALRKL
jgi:hypothetical protein